MKQFRSLDITYERLKSEVQSLTIQSIEKTAELNLVSYKLKETAKEYKEVKQLLQEDIFKNKVDIINYNKDFIQKLKDKDEELKKLQEKLCNKKNKLNELDLKLIKQEIWLQVSELNLNTLERQLNNKNKVLIKKQEELNKKSIKMIESEKKFNKVIKEKGKEYKELENNIKWIRDESEVTTQILNSKLEKIEKQKMVIEINTKRLAEKELKIKSEMKVLISSREYINK